MRLKKLVIGNTSVKNNVLMAPMAGYTDYAFRSMVTELGAGITYTELVSAKGLIYGGKNNSALLYCGGDYENTVAQIFGSEEYFMRAACESEYLKNFNIIDINMGCPVPKVFKNGDGSALLSDIKKAERLVRECVKSGKNITVKIRIGLKKGDDIATEFSKMAEDSGAKAITIHGRVREDYYSGEPNFSAIERAKAAVSIPVIANGGIFTEKDAADMMDKTGADGVMLARGGIANPFLFSSLTGTKTDYTLKSFMTEHLLRMQKLRGDMTAVEFRKFVPYYLKGKIGVKDIKAAINSSCSVEEIVDLIAKL